MPAKSSGCKFLRGSLQTSEWPRAEQRVPGQSRGAGGRHAAPQARPWPALQRAQWEMWNFCEIFSIFIVSF